MNITITRRAALVGALTALPIARSLAAARPGADTMLAATQSIEALERKNGGRLGVMALDTETNATIEHRPDERFPITSTFKFLAAAGVLKRVDDGKEQLGDKETQRRTPRCAISRAAARLNGVGNAH
jgi:beta-lactamase class A